jgi:hypothetical protein
MSHKLTKEMRKSLAEFAAAITHPNNRPGAARPGAAVFAASQAPAVNHERRLLAKYEAGGWPAVERYLQPFLTPAGYARQLKERAADARAAAADAAPADFQPLAIDEPAPVAPVVALAAAGAPGYGNALATGAPAEHAWLDEAGPVHIGLDVSTAPAKPAVFSGFVHPAGRIHLHGSTALTRESGADAAQAAAVHRPGTLPGGPTCAPGLPYDPTAATQRLQLAYEAGVNVPGELYEAHREVQQAPRSLCVGDNAGNCAACLQAGPGCITADFIPRYSCDCGREPAAPRPLAEQLCSFAGELSEVIAEHKAAGTLPELSVLAGRPYDVGTDADMPLQQLQADICRQHCTGTCGVCLL